jgi:hypothetical protein
VASVVKAVDPVLTAATGKVADVAEEVLKPVASVAKVVEPVLTVVTAPVTEAAEETLKPAIWAVKALETDLVASTVTAAKSAGDAVKAVVPKDSSDIDDVTTRVASGVDQPEPLLAIASRPAGVEHDDIAAPVSKAQVVIEDVGDTLSGDLEQPVASGGSIAFAAAPENDTPPHHLFTESGYTDYGLALNADRTNSVSKDRPADDDNEAGQGEVAESGKDDARISEKPEALSPVATSSFVDLSGTLDDPALRVGDSLF